MAVIPYKGAAEFPKLPTHTPILVRVMEANFANEKNPFAGDGEPETRDVINFVLECVDDQFWKARVWDKMSASIHERSHLRPFIQACHPADLTLEQLKSFDTDDLVGKQVMVVGEYDTSRDPEQKWLRPKSYLRAPKATEPATKKAEPVTVPDDTDALDF